LGTKTIRGALHNFRRQLEQGKKVRLGLGLDRFFTLQPGEILVFMARAGVGKTAWAVNILQNLMEQGYRVMFFSLEMSDVQILLRLAQLYYGRPKHIIEEGYKREGDGYLEEMLSAYDDFIIEDTNALTTGEVKWKTKMVAPDVIVIDYLQYLRAQGSEDGSYAKATRNMLNLKALAKDVEIPLIVLSQTSRAGGSGDTPISMEMGRDTGAIEETADYLLGAWRKDDDTIQCRVLKNRHGRLGTVLWTFEADVMRFIFKDEEGY